MTDKNSQDLSVMSAQPMEIELGGKKYKASAPTISDLGALQQRVKQDKMEMLATVLKASGEDRDYITQQILSIMNAPLKEAEQQAAFQNTKSVVFLIWKCLEHYNPDITEEEVEKNIDNNNINEIATLLFSGMSKAKNAKRVSPKKAKK